MTGMDIRPADSARLQDVTHALSGGGDGRGCQCQWWVLPNSEWNQTSKDDRAALLRAQLGNDPPPGLIAYVDGVPAGWVRVGPRTVQARLARTREFQASSESFDDPAVWAVTCFVLRKEFRGLSLMSRLLEAAVGHARESGARVIEGYPIDPAAGKSRLSSSALFRGTLPTFTRAGFNEVARPRPDRVIVARTLDE